MSLKETQKNRVYVGNLTNDIKPAVLYSHFIRCGQIISINKKFTKYAFIEFESALDAQRAIQTLNNSFINGTKIVVNELLSENERKKLKTNVNDDATIDVSFANSYFAPKHAYQGKNSIHKDLHITNSVNCEILAENRDLRSFAELIERQLGMLGISSDVSFMNSSFVLNKVLGGFRNKGVYAAIIIKWHNASFNSMNIIFLNEAICHENIPFTDGIKLIYKKLIVEKSLQNHHPEDISSYIKTITDNQHLTVSQYDKLLSYLRVKKDEQMKIEIGDGESFKKERHLKDFIDVGLQKQIFDILKQNNGKSTENNGKLSVSERKLLFEKMQKDENVVKAIQTLKKAAEKSKIQEPIAGTSK